jgi:hypothetical protein
MSDTREEETPEFEISEEQAAQIDEAAAAAANAIGSDAASLGLAAHLLAETEVQVLETAEQTGERATPETLEAAQRSLVDILNRFADGVASFELPEIPYEVATGEKIDGVAVTETRTVPPGTYELVTIKTLTGERRRKAHALFADMGGFVIRWGAGGTAADYLTGATLIATSERFCELLGWLYRRTDRLPVPAEAIHAVGSYIDEQMNTENVVGVCQRFFSSSGSGQADGILDFFQRFLGVATNWISSLTKRL